MDGARSPYARGDAPVLWPCCQAAAPDIRKLRRQTVPDRARVATRPGPGSALAQADSPGQGTCVNLVAGQGRGGLAGCSHPDPVRNQNKGSSERERPTLGSGTHLAKAATATLAGYWRRTPPGGAGRGYRGPAP
jgi:hypothetical protein